MQFPAQQGTRAHRGDGPRGLGCRQFSADTPWAAGGSGSGTVAPVRPSVKPAAGLVAPRHARPWKGSCLSAVQGERGAQTAQLARRQASQHTGHAPLSACQPPGLLPESGFGAGRRSPRGAQQGADAVPALLCVVSGTSARPQARLLPLQMASQDPEANRSQACSADSHH